jgi:undecaprenyl pyrophosphate phosphatase UppP
MSDCTTVFETLKEFLPISSIANFVEKTKADYGTKKFTVSRHLTTLMYVHLTKKDSLRAITDGILADKKLQKYTDTISAS